MLLIEARPVPTPADAERLVADLWQVTAGRGLALFTFGFGARVVLGVRCPHAGVEEAAAGVVADQCGGAIESGEIVEEIAGSSLETAAVNLVPTERRLALESRTFGWQRSDPLRGTFLALRATPAGALSAVALSLRALPDLAFVASLGAFVTGRGARNHAVRLAASFGGVGVHIRRPVLQRQSARRMLAGALRRPAAVVRTEVVARYWHPPYASDAGLVHQPVPADPQPLLAGGDT